MVVVVVAVGKHLQKNRTNWGKLKSKAVLDLRFGAGMKNCASKVISEVCSTEIGLCGVNSLINLWG